MLTPRRESRRNPVLLLAATLLMLGALIVALPVAPAAAKPAKKVTVTFNAAGGKIGKKATLKRKVRKGGKLGKLPKATGTGHSFKGWYTKKTGGKKATASMRIRAKTVIWARWKRVLTTDEKQLVGKWSSRRDAPFDQTLRRIEFRGNGTFLYYLRSQGIAWDPSTGTVRVIGEAGTATIGGDFALRSGRIVATNVKYSWQTTSGAANYRDRPGKDLDWSFEYADRPYSQDFFDDPAWIAAWINGAPWLNIKMHPELVGIAQWEAFQRPDA